MTFLIFVTPVDGLCTAVVCSSVNWSMTKTRNALNATQMLYIAMIHHHRLIPHHKSPVTGLGLKQSPPHKLLTIMLSRALILKYHMMFCWFFETCFLCVFLLHQNSWLDEDPKLQILATIFWKNYSQSLLLNLKGSANQIHSTKFSVEEELNKTHFLLKCNLRCKLSL